MTQRTIICENRYNPNMTRRIVVSMVQKYKISRYQLMVNGELRAATGEWKKISSQL